MPGYRRGPLSRPDIFELTLELAREYGLAVRVSNLPAIERLRREGLPGDDHDLLDSYELLVSDEAREVVRQEGIVLLGHRELQPVWRTVA